MEKDKLIKVKNRNNGTSGYKIPEMQNLQRQFAPGESKDIPFEELQRLYWLPGGDVLLKNHLIIEDKEAIKALQMEVEPEYFYTDEQIAKIMQEGTLNQFLDMIDFSNEGVRESIKDLAVTLPLNDVEKREAIQEKLGFNVTGAIEIRKAQMTNTKEEDKPKARRVQENPEKRERRYKISE